MSKHKHADLIHAWADGAEIEKFNHGIWEDDELPMWYPNFQYRIKDPYRELKAAAADPTKQIRIKGAANWFDVGDYAWNWDAPVEDYQIRDKPKAKVKMWQWVCRTKRGTSLSSRFYPHAPVLGVGIEVLFRAPWTEIEVDAP